MAHHYGDFMKNRLSESNQTKNKKKEKTMATTIKDLTAVVEKQSAEIATLRSRVSGLVDELATQKASVDTLRDQLTKDMQRVISSVRANMMPNVGISV